MFTGALSVAGKGFYEEPSERYWKGGTIYGEVYQLGGFYTEKYHIMYPKISKIFLKTKSI